MAMILFDVGGTLLKINPEPREIYIEIFDEMDYKISKDKLYRAIVYAKSTIEKTYDKSSHSNNDSFPLRFNSLLLRECGLPCDEASSKMITRMFANNIRFSKYPETESVLNELHKEHAMGIISNWNLDKDLDDVLRQNEIDRFFDYTLASKDVGCEKPDPIIFKMALDGMGGDAKDTYYVGDSYVEDVVGALRMGMRPIFVNRRNEPNPDNVPSVSDLEGILNLIE